jgi:FeS cluster assembly scaffold protein NifU
MYTEKVMDHFQNPRNVGELKNADAVGEVGSISCGDIMRIYLKVNKDEVIEDVSFKTFGCAAAVASSSVMTEMVKGKTIEDALKITKKDISEKLGGLPGPKVHCSILATEALEKAIENYRLQ